MFLCHPCAGGLDLLYRYSKGIDVTSSTAVLELGIHKNTALLKQLVFHWRGKEMVKFTAFIIMSLINCFLLKNVVKEKHFCKVFTMQIQLQFFCLTTNISSVLRCYLSINHLETVSKCWYIFFKCLCFPCVF